MRSQESIASCTTSHRSRRQPSSGSRPTSRSVANELRVAVLQHLAASREVILSCRSGPPDCPIEERVRNLESCSWEYAMLQVRRKKGPPDHVLKRTYQNELRAMGRYCDDKGLRAIGLYEVEDGFLLRAFADPNDPHSIEAIEVPKDDVQ